MHERESYEDIDFVYPAGEGVLPASRVDLVFDQIVARIEPITRFDRSSLVRQDGQERIANGTARWRSEIAIQVQNYTGTGSLGSSVIQVEGSSLSAAVSAAVDAAWAALPGRIDRWLEAFGLSDRELAAEDCFDGPVTYGHQYRCEGCGGKGENQCGRCHGRGDYTCTGCQGDGTQSCFSCSGRGTSQCVGCGGRGSQMIQQSRQVFNSNTNNYETEYYTQQQSCLSCGGRGSQPCGGCYGKGTSTCNSCFGSGKERCGSCSGSGSIRCSPCNGTGLRHETRQVSCHVSHRWQVMIQDPNEEVNARLGKLVLGSLAEQGQVSVEPPDRGHDYLERRYRFQVDIAEMTVGVGAHQVLVTGFGETAQVHDFQNIAGHLLQADLAQLQAEVGKGPAFSLTTSPPLRAAVQQVLDSEANIAVGSVPGNNPTALKALVGKQYAGAVSLEYARAVSTHLRTALGRLFLPALFYPAACVIVLPTVLFLLSQLTAWGKKNFEPAAAGAILVSAVTWMVMERTMRKRFAAEFGAGKAEVVERLVEAQGVLVRWRVVAAVVGVGLVAVVAKLT